MNKRQINTIEMYRIVNHYLQQNKAVWEHIGIVSKYHDALSALIKAVGTTSQEQQAAKVYIGKSQLALKLLVAKKVNVLDDSLNAFAEDCGDAELISISGNSASKYFRLPNEEFSVAVNKMLYYVSEYLPELEIYGVKQIDLDDLTYTFTTFERQKPIPNTRRVVLGIATDKLARHFANGRILLKKLDKVLKRFKVENATFYNGYTSARHIIKK